MILLPKDYSAHVRARALFQVHQIADAWRPKPFCVDVVWRNGGPCVRYWILSVMVFGQ